MTQPRTSSIVLQFANGDKVAGFESLTFSENFVEPLPRMTVNLAPPPGKLLEYATRLGKGREFTFHVGGAQQARMVVVGINASLGGQGSGDKLAINAAGVLRTAMHSSAPYRYHNRSVADIPVTKWVLDMMEPYGFDIVLANSAANITAQTGRPFAGGVAPVTLAKLKGKELNLQPGETAYQVAARVLGRLGVLLRVDYDGNLLIDLPDYTTEPIYTVQQESRVKGDPMVGNVDISDSNEGQHSEYIVEGKAPDTAKSKSAGAPVNGIIVEGAPRSAGFERAKLETSPRWRHHYYGDGRHATCPHYKLDKRARDKVWCLAMAKTILGAKAVSAFQVKCNVVGIVAASSGRVWTLNTQGRVVVPRYGLDETMWLYAREFSVSGAGELARLTWVPRGALYLGDASS